MQVGAKPSLSGLDLRADPTVAVSANKSRHLPKFLAIILGSGAALIGAGVLGLVGAPVSLVVGGGLTLGIGVAGTVYIVHKIAQKILHSRSDNADLAQETSSVQQGHKITFSREFTQRLLETVQPLSKEITSTMQEKSNLIQNHINQLPRDNAAYLIQILNSVSEELNSIGQKMNQLKRIGQDLMIAFSEDNITDCDFQVCQRALNSVIEELVKVSNSTLYFIENSLVDENTVFFSAWPDQEIGRTDIETPINQIIHQELSLANKMLLDCERFLGVLEEGDDKALASVVLSYTRIQQIVQLSQGILSEELNLIPEKSHQGRIDTLTREIQELENADDRSNARNITRKKELIQRFENRKTAYELGAAEIEQFENRLANLTEQLQNRNIVGLDNEPIGELTFTLTNPVISGEYTVPAREFKSLADAYSDYINDLHSLQKKSREATLAFSELNRKLEESVFTPQPELGLDI